MLREKVVPSIQVVWQDGMKELSRPAIRSEIFRDITSAAWWETISEQSLNLFQPDMFGEMETTPAGLHIFKESYLDSGAKIEAPPTVEENVTAAQRLSGANQVELIKVLMNQLGLSVEELAEIADDVTEVEETQ